MFGLYQGIVTQDALGTVTFTFGDYHRLNIKGLTIDFGDFYPTSFTVSNGNADNTYTSFYLWKDSDLTGDGKVNGKDITLLQRYVAGGYNVIL